MVLEGTDALFRCLQAARDGADRNVDAGLGSFRGAKQPENAHDEECNANNDKEHKEQRGEKNLMVEQR
jgi:hypothetical protein